MAEAIHDRLGGSSSEEECRAEAREYNEAARQLWSKCVKLRLDVLEKKHGAAKRAKR
jgi:hypothetical protein